MSEPHPDEEGAKDQALGDLLGRLVEDGKGYAQAELGYYRTLARAKLRDARAALWMGAVSLGLLSAAMVALTVGLVMTLAQYVGPGWATLLVVVAISAIAGVMARLAWVQVKRIVGEKP
ncbi:MAG: phage holin family protein [Sphingomonas sp.]|uniref:phage holin family protein n=1 Tax=Sphingomonas sp. TaxID=28214 RepID=UPI0025CBFC2D|nr:phage holin family protein [Sphingomonas sp.]MBX3564638.1 phage holin family protein [Sphingomonas sp.]